ncbi:uracil phosphoribosyltransferase [Methanomassiliicoccales archaeon LGM-RCC1]|nr:uracil phosphoribosyltransferase [Candidatus Methanomethylophilaceae archaeon]MBR4685641.1 uracil phosphoribosyltransferase [Candidatus Methanomethylophilaceae archaeon]WII07145.1 uracil phosphoribosyltransferase [Methanomassiliicoccales archaeon LGM-RCC1]
MDFCPNIHVLDHPLIRHKVAMLRDVNTGHKDFRDLITEIATLMVYESFRDVPTMEIEVQTPLEKCKQTVVKDDCIAVIPILRAGLGMVEGILNIFPSAKVGHIGLYRDEETHQPIEYYCKLPDRIEEKVVIVTDPMLATGGSASEAITMLKKHGCKKIKLLSIIAAPTGAERVHKDHPDVEVYISTMDRELNENAYILPGLGDAGDRIFGTK